MGVSKIRPEETCTSHAHFPSYSVELMTYMGDWEIASVNQQETPTTDHQEKTQ